MLYQNPISRCSKAPRGLSVLMRVMRIFTHATTSPSPSLRQRSSRYAFRAGRNLPDKEFRYLRTVIVTAAIHQGFDSELRSEVGSWRSDVGCWILATASSQSEHTAACLYSRNAPLAPHALPLVYNPDHTQSPESPEPRCTIRQTHPRIA